MRASPIDSRDAGLRNERLVIALLRRHRELSQAQLCKLAGLSSSTASYIVGRLRQKGLIRERPGESRKRGAKPVIVSIDPRGRLIVGAELSPSRVHLGLFDFNGELIEGVYAPLGTDHAPPRVLDVLEINLRGLLGKHRIDEERLLGVGVTLSGSITREGVVALSSPLGWKDVPLRELLQARFRAPVSVHTTRVRLLAELSLRPDLASRNVLCLNVANGVGAHMIVDGQLLHGATDRAGELGHVIFDPDGPACGCGHRGCLEASISGPALAARIRRDLEAGRATVLAGRVAPDDLPESVVAAWGAALAEGDAYAAELRELLAHYISRAATIAINCFDPDVLILTGYVCEQCPDDLIDAIQRRVPTDVYDSAARQVRIVLAQAGEQALIQGVAAAVLRQAAEVV